MVLPITIALFVQNIPNGVLLRDNLDLYEKKADWSIIVAIEDTAPELEKQIRQESTKFLTYLQTTAVSKANILHKDYWKSRIRNGLQQMRIRSKRGLLNVIGSLSNTLFGTATEEEITELQGYVDENRNSVNGISHQVTELVTIANSSHATLNANRAAINKLTKATDSLRKWMEETQLNVSAAIHRLITYNMVERAVEDIESHMNLLASTRAKHRRQVAQLHRGRLGESLLSPTVFDELQSMQPVPGAKLLDTEWYYEYCRITPLWDSGEHAGTLGYSRVFLW